MNSRMYHTITRGDGATLRLRTEAWQHTPYEVYMPLSAAQITRVRRFQAASVPMQRDDGSEEATAHDPLRWGGYGARVVPLLAKKRGDCPHCPLSTSQEKGTRA